MEEGKETCLTLSTACPAIPACLDHPSWEPPLLGSLLLPHSPAEKRQWIQNSGISCQCSHVTALPICLASAALCCGHEVTQPGGQEAQPWLQPAPDLDP